MGSTWTWRMWPTELLPPAFPVLVFGPYIGVLAMVTIWIYAKWKFYSLICALGHLSCPGTQLKRFLLSWTPSTKTGFGTDHQHGTIIFLYFLTLAFPQVHDVQLVQWEDVRHVVLPRKSRASSDRRPQRAEPQADAWVCRQGLTICLCLCLCFCPCICTHEFCQKFYTTKFLGQRFYTLNNAEIATTFANDLPMILPEYWIKHFSIF